MKYNYYTLAGLITSLRKNYQRLSIDLKLLAEYIDIDNKENITKELEIITNTKEENYLNLFLYNKNKLLAIYKINQENNQYKMDLEKGYNNLKTPTIIDQEYFNIYVKSILKNPLYNLKQIKEDINPYQTLYIDNNEITLINTDNSEKNIIISYNRKKDNISVKANKKYTKFFIEELMETKIPSYCLKEKDNNIISKQYHNTFEKNVYIDSAINNRHDDLKINNKGKRLVLLKKESTN